MKSTQEQIHELQKQVADLRKHLGMDRNLPGDFTKAKINYTGTATYAPEEGKDIPPPGIISMKDKNGHVTYFESCTRHTYANWHECFTVLGYLPHSISVEGVTFSVGEEVQWGSLNRKWVIERFQFDKDKKEWRVKFATQFTSVAVGTLRKLPPQEERKAVCQLPDETGKMIDMFEGDRYWFIPFETWKIISKPICKGQGVFPQLSFATEAAAIKYVKETKGVYPESLVEELVTNSSRMRALISHHFNDIKQKNESICEKLGKFKQQSK